MLAGAFIAAGALLATLLVVDIDAVGMRRLLEGFGFSVGFFVVILSGGLLFTEVNVEIPATMLSGRAEDVRHQLLRLRVPAAAGHLAGAFVAGQPINIASDFSPIDLATLMEIAEYRDFYSLVGPTGAGPGWGTGLWWAIVPAAIGNILGGALLVALPFWYAGTRRPGR